MWFRRTLQALTRREHFFMSVMGIIVGVAGGYATIIFQLLIGVVIRAGWGSFSEAANHQAFLAMATDVPVWAKIAVPTAGMFLTAVLVTAFAKETKGPGVSEVMESVALRDGHIRPRTIWVKNVVSSLCIGSGGSVGLHGPMVHIGSALGSALGQIARMTGTRLRTMVACGAAAGIAATFNAPMAGAIFALEVILGEFAAAQFIPIVLSSVMATVVSRHYLGNFPAFEVPPYDLLHYSELFLYLVLGVVAGVISFAFIRTLYTAEDVFDRWKTSPYLKAATGGIVIGSMGIIAPRILGVGYDTVTQVLRGELLGPVLVGLLVAKIVATSFTLGSGGSGGVFAPSLFIGAVTGGAFGHLVHTLLPLTTASPGAYALVGMGAIVAGTQHAPITAMLIIFEMTADYRIILPLMFACTIGFVISALLSRESIYTLKLVKRGINIHGGQELNVLKSLKVSQVMRPEIELVAPSTPLAELMTRMMSSSHPHMFVVTSDQRIQGYVSLDMLRPILRDYESVGAVINASDLMTRELVVVRPDDTLDMVMELFGRFELHEIPVVQGGQTVGTVWENDVIEAYNREVFKRDMASGLAVSFRVQQKMRAEHLALLGEFEILEVPSHRSLVGKNLAQLKLRERFGATIMTIKRKPGDADDRVTYVLPEPATVIAEGDVLIVFGLQKDLSRFPRG
jgi:CIC family chloride channel protein